MIEAGKILQQRYRIDKQIGQGGMGAVYIATDERFGSTVAIKQTLAMGDRYQRAIEHEAHLLNTLKHPALPRVSDHFLEADGQFLVMEYIPGNDLSQMIEATGEPFSVERVLRWADQLLDALDFLHNQSIPVIHRDIKPQNLKLTSRDQIVLLDFGLAKGNPTKPEHQTAAKSIFGYSRNYAPLEQIEGTGTDPRSDLYSLGATLFHLATGVPPEDALTRAMSVLTDGPDPLEPANAIRPEVPPGLTGVLHKALSLNAKERPSSAVEMRKMLRECETRSDLAEPVTAVKGNVISTDIHVQKTRLMPTRRQWKGFSVGKMVSVFAAVVLICGTASGLYFYKPSLDGAEALPPPVAEPAIKQDSNPLELSSAGPRLSSEIVESNERRGEKTKPAQTTEASLVETSTRRRSSPNSNVIIQRDRRGSVYIGNNVWIGNRQLPANTYYDRNGKVHRISPNH